MIASKIKEFIKVVMVICFTIGGFLIVKKFYKEYSLETLNTELDTKTETLKKFLLTHQKPQRIEITNLTKRLEKEVNKIKKLKVPQEKNSNFYISIQFFTDENDEKAPLVAQIRFIETVSGNTIKEESLNLE